MLSAPYFIPGLAFFSPLSYLSISCVLNSTLSLLAHIPSLSDIVCSSSFDFHHTYMAAYQYPSPDRPRRPQLPTHLTSSALPSSYALPRHCLVLSHHLLTSGNSFQLFPSEHVRQAPSFHALYVFIIQFLFAPQTCLSLTQFQSSPPLSSIISRRRASVSCLLCQQQGPRLSASRLM